MNKKNLLILAKHLETVPQENFHMGSFRGEVSRLGFFRPMGFKSVHDCGTVGCALGHAPLAKGLGPIEKDFDTTPMGRSSLVFSRYSERVLGISVLPTHSIWDWCFSYAWECCDNTPRGAAARIRYLVEHGDVPKEFFEPEERWIELYKNYFRKEKK